MRRDRGFALVAVLVASVALAGVAYDVLLQNRTAIVEAQAELDRAHMEAAANSATMLAVVALGQAQVDARPPIDGTPRRLSVDGMDVTVSVEDERGKVPINVLSEQEVRRLFEAAGARGRQLDTLTDSFLDWRDDDDQRRPFGAENRDYAPRGYRSRDGDFTSPGELARVNGMTPALLARITPAITLWFGESGGFSERTAGPLAFAVMTAGDGDSGDPANTEREEARPAARSRSPIDDELRGRRLLVRVLVRDPRGGLLRRSTIVELTGNPRQPIWIRDRS